MNDNVIERRLSDSLLDRYLKAVADPFSTDENDADLEGKIMGDFASILAELLERRNAEKALTLSKVDGFRQAKKIITSMGQYPKVGFAAQAVTEAAVSTKGREVAVSAVLCEVLWLLSDLPLIEGTGNFDAELALTCIDDMIDDLMGES